MMGKILRMKYISLLLLVFSLAIAAPCSLEAQTPVRSSGYRIGPRDLLEIRVFETPELNVSRRVSEDGKINLPLVGEIEVGGMTENEAAQKIKDVLEGKLLQRASVAVQVQEFRSRPISLIGSVRQPGNLSFSGRWTLLEAITAAGGLAEGHGNLVYVLRRSENGLSDQVAVTVDDLLVRADQKANIPIIAGDLINVPGTVEVTVYCLGEFHQPGALSFKSSDRITLLTVIARAGGLTDRASNKILIKRNTPGSAKTEITANYKRILAGEDPDVELEPGDVVVIKESFF
jgi:polysaccharide biosynthesis/export protein